MSVFLQLGLNGFEHFPESDNFSSKGIAGFKNLSK
jgi:hypothetical protein